MAFQGKEARLSKLFYFLSLCSIFVGIVTASTEENILPIFYGVGFALLFAAYAQSPLFLLQSVIRRSKLISFSRRSSNFFLAGSIIILCAVLIDRLIY